MMQTQKKPTHTRTHDQTEQPTHALQLPQKTYIETRNELFLKGVPYKEERLTECFALHVGEMVYVCFY